MSLDRQDLDELVERVAQRVAELLRDDLPAQGRLLSVAEYARLIGRSTDYVREHAEELGGIRQPTTGARALWRFPATADPRQPDPTPAAPARAPGRVRRSRQRTDLLPIRGRTA